MKNTNKVLFAILMIGMIFPFVNKSFSQVTDIDGNTYKTITIGTQEWTAENLNVEHYRNGDPIPQVQDADEWGKLTYGAWCYSENKKLNGKTYGKLYNWYALNDPRGFAPEGWHIPSDVEWNILIDYLGGGDVAGGKMKAKTKWESPNTGATNESGFTGLPGGLRGYDGIFYYIGKTGDFWSSSEESYENGSLRYLVYVYSEVYKNINDKRNGLAVRCVKD